MRFQKTFLGDVSDDEGITLYVVYQRNAVDSLYLDLQFFRATLLFALLLFRGEDTIHVRLMLYIV